MLLATLLFYISQIPIVSALDWKDKVTVMYELERATTPIIDATGRINGTIVGTPVSIAGLLGNGTLVTHGNYWNFTGNSQVQSIQTVAFWIRNWSGTTYYWITDGSGSSGGGFLTTTVMGYAEDAGTNTKYIATNQVPSTGNLTWTLIVFMYNASGGGNKIWINNVSQSLTVESMTKPGNMSRANMKIATNPGLIMTIDNFMLSSSAWGQEDVNQFWNAGVGRNYTGTTVNPPTWINPTPDSGTTNNTQVTLNATCNGAGEQLQLWFGNSSMQYLVQNSTTWTYTTNVTVETTYTYNASCFNSSLGLSSEMTAQRTWKYDLTFPTITLNSNNEFTINNVSRSNQYDTSTILNMTFSDNIALYAYMINITKNGVVFYNETNSSLSGTQFNYSKVLNVGTWNSGDYNVRVMVSDSHTANSISNYQVTKKTSSITFKTENDNNIKIATRATSYIDATKLPDRYTFNITFDDGFTTDRMFDVKTDKCPLKYMNNTGYKGHFVSYCMGETTGNWIDFEGGSGTPIINKQDDYHYTVYFSTLPPNIVFKSIGGLNIYDANFTWYKGNITYTNTTGIINEETNFILNMTNTTGMIITANFTYNGTSRTVQTTTGTNTKFNSSFIMPGNQGLYNGTWTVTVNETTTQYTFNINISQQVVTFTLDDCSTATNQSLRFYYYDENTPTTSLNSQLEATFNYSLSSEWTNSKTYSTTKASSNNHTFCVYPNNIPFYVDAEIVYNNSNGFRNRYYLRNITLNGTTRQDFNLYNVQNANQLGSTISITSGNSTESNTTSTTYSSTYTTLKLTSRYASNYQYYKNVITALQRFYVGEGVWRTIQMDESGEYGQINFHILERDVEYRLVFQERTTTNILKTTQGMKFSCPCDLTYLLNPLTATTAKQAIAYTVSLDNASSVLQFDWTHIGADSTVRFLLTRTTITGIATICDQTQTGQAGTYACNASLYTGDVMLNIYQDGSILKGEYLTLPKTDLSDYLPNGEGAFWAVMIMIICLCFGLFSPVGSIITGIIGLIIIYLMGILSPLTLSGLVIAMIIGTVIGVKVKA